MTYTYRIPPFFMLQAPANLIVCGGFCFYDQKMIGPGSFQVNVSRDFLTIGVLLLVYYAVLLLVYYVNFSRLTFYASLMHNL